MPQLTERQSPIRRPVERRGDAKDLAPPFAERNRKSPFLAEFDVGQRSLPHIIQFVRTFRLHGLDVALQLIGV